MLALDERLGEIQLDMLRGASPKLHNELVRILGIITEAIQELGRYSDGPCRRCRHRGTSRLACGGAGPSFSTSTADTSRG